MWRRHWTALMAAGVTFGMIGLAPAVTAGPTTLDEFRTALEAASASSGAFAKGTTISGMSMIIDRTATGAETHINSATVNPDGSLSQYGDLAGIRDLQTHCVRVDRCWTKSPSQYGDRKWHRLPAGSVTLQNTSASWAILTGMQWPEGSTFEIVNEPGGVTRFRVTYTDVESDVAQAMSYTFDGAQVSFGFFVSMADGPALPVMVVILQADTRHVDVAPPARATVGRPVQAPATPYGFSINR